MDKIRNGENRPTSPLAAIHCFCDECMGYETREIKNCISTLCPLFEFRNGKNPYHKKNLTDEQRKELGERMRKAKKPNKDT